MVRPAGEKQRGCGLWMHAAYGIIAGTAEGRTGRHDTERICHTSADAAHHAWEVRTGRQYARFGVYHHVYPAPRCQGFFEKTRTNAVMYSASHEMGHDEIRASETKSLPRLG